MSELHAVGLPGLAVLVAASIAAGAINSVAGGGTILTFPVLTAILPETAGRLVAANATSTIGLMPGALAAAWAYREERQGQPPWALWLLAPSVIGSVAATVWSFRPMSVPNLCASAKWLDVSLSPGLF